VIFYAVEHGTHIAKITFSPLPGIAILIPIAGALAVFIVGDRSEKFRNLLAIAFSAASFLCCVLIFPRVFSHGRILQTTLPLFFGEFVVSADRLGLIFALVASGAWLFSTIYAYSYIQHEERRTRYHTFSLLTEAATLGVFLASNFFVLFVFFELMGMLAYVLVVHSQTYEARKAGVKYIFMTIYGGLSLLAGIVLYYSYANGVSFAPGEKSAYLLTSACFIAVSFMMVGYGIKAGMIPLHVWLPLAHPAAPSPASALLSGVMIKAGAFGLIRLIGTFHVGAAAHGSAGVLASSGGGEHAPAVHASANMANLHVLGWALIVLAVVTMVGGMILALVQTNIKRLLAYSSISQMGYILMGLGAAAFLGHEGAMGLAGGIYHILNHTMFKALLFLGVGAVYYSTHTLQLTELGGLWKKMPVTAFLCCVAGLGIMGIPLFNGFASKTLLHHAIVEAAHVGGPLIKAVEVIFIITAGGTICYIAKLILLTFFGHYRGIAHDSGSSKREVSADSIHAGAGSESLSSELVAVEHVGADVHNSAGSAGEHAREVPFPMQIGMAAFACGILVFGLFPHLVLSKIIAPVLGSFANLDPHMVHHIAEEHIFTLSNIKGILPSLGVGITFFVVAMKWDLFRLKLPETFGIDYYYSKAEIGFLRLCLAGSKRHAELRAKYWPLAKSLGQYIYEWGVSVRSRYRERRRAVIDRIVTIPLDIQGFAAYILARQFTGDIAYGTVIIAVVIALLAIGVFLK